MKLVPSYQRRRNHPEHLRRCYIAVERIRSLRLAWFVRPARLRLRWRLHSAC